jgi:hypothetical protein
MKNLFKRFYDLIIKLVSVKGLFAISAFITFARQPDEYSFYAAIIFCSLLVVGREYGKLLEVLKLIKGK